MHGQWQNACSHAAGCARVANRSFYSMMRRVQSGALHFSSLFFSRVEHDFFFEREALMTFSKKKEAYKKYIFFNIVIVF
jgi:hypothetical protein